MPYDIHDFAIYNSNKSLGRKVAQTCFEILRQKYLAIFFVWKDSDKSTFDK